MHEGRYFALIKPEKDGKWYNIFVKKLAIIHKFISLKLKLYNRFRFIDDHVIPAIDNEVLENNCGDAIMLFYIRESNVNEILSPVVPEDIPNQLCVYVHLFEVN